MRIATTLVLAAALLLAACGGGDGDDSGEETLANDEYIERADEICASDDEQTAELLGDFTDADLASDFEGAADAFEAALELSAETFAEVGDLPPPEEDTETLDEVFAAYEEQVGFAEQLVAALREHNQEEARSAGESLVEAQEEMRGHAEDFGFHECGLSQGD